MLYISFVKKKKEIYQIGQYLRTLYINIYTCLFVYHIRWCSGFDSMMTDQNMNNRDPIPTNKKSVIPLIDIINILQYFTANNIPTYLRQEEKCIIHKTTQYLDSSRDLFLRFHQYVKRDCLLKSLCYCIISIVPTYA